MKKVFNIISSRAIKRLDQRRDAEKKLCQKKCRFRCMQYSLPLSHLCVLQSRIKILATSNHLFFHAQKSPQEESERCEVLQTVIEKKSLQGKKKNVVVVVVVVAPCMFFERGCYCSSCCCCLLVPTPTGLDNKWSVRSCLNRCSGGGGGGGDGNSSSTKRVFDLAPI